MKKRKSYPKVTRKQRQNERTEIKNFAETIAVKPDNKFIADVHLGKLAKGLRMAGFDVLYQTDYTHSELKTVAVQQDRVLLSRNVAFAKDSVVKTFILQSEDWYVQLQQVVEKFKLRERFKPFTRCLACNGVLQSVSKEEKEPQLEENTRNYYNEFWQCDNCKRIYWKGSHYERMKKLISELKRSTEEK